MHYWIKFNLSFKFQGLHVVSHFSVNILDVFGASVHQLENIVICINLALHVSVQSVSFCIVYLINTLDKIKETIYVLNTKILYNNFALQVN